MGLFREFKEFALRGNVIDMAVGIIVGAAFGKIVSSLVGDVILPALGLLLAGMDFSRFAITLRGAVGDKPAVLLGYGKFIQTVVDFIVIAVVIFFVIVKPVNIFKKKGSPTPPAPPAPSNEEKLLSEIRDLLKAKLG
ncbi:MAG: large-conductance mechanosensitive channel protein MscL [bacterium]